MRTEAELRELLQQADELPFGAAQIAMVEQVVHEADAQQLTDLMFEARMEATSAYRFGGESARAVVTFSWCLAEFDRDPARYAGHQWLLLWQLKSTVGALTLFPEVPLERTYSLLDDMERRWRDYGATMHAVYALRHRVARHIGAVDRAEEYYAKWCATPRDDLSNCAGCDPSAKASWLARQGRDEAAVALLEPVLAGGRTCRAQPQDILTTLLFPYLRTGRLEQARDAHRRAYRLHRPMLADLSDIADHIEFCARTGNAARGVEILERHLGWLDRAPSPLAAMSFAGAGALVLRQSLRTGTEVALHRPAHGERAAAEVPASVLGAELAALSLEIAGRFDVRNGTGHQSTKMRAVMDSEPLVEHLSLAPTPPRRVATAAEIFAKTPAAPPSTVDIKPEPLPESATAEELLALIEQGQDTQPMDWVRAALVELDIRFPDQLTARQRARRDEEWARLLTEAGDLAGAEERWRSSEVDYDASGSTEDARVSRARRALILCETGRVDEGLPMLTEATELIRRDSTTPEVRVEAGVRLARCLGDQGRPDEGLSIMDDLAAELPAAPPRSQALAATRHLILLLQAGRMDEVAERAGPTLATARASGTPRMVGLTHVVLARWRESVGDQLGAGEQYAQAIGVEQNADQARVVRMMRAAVLAGTEQAGLVLDDLVEEVAARTADGDEPGVAEIRYSLALCYSTLDRPLDAAEVAEDELAYRLRQDAEGLDDHTPSHATRVRYLLSELYGRLEQWDDGLAQLDAIAADHTRINQPGIVARMHEDAADLLDRIDRDDAAAARYLAAAEGFAEVGWRLDELRNRRRHALSLHWAHGFERAIPALEVADALAAPEGDQPGLAWERAMLNFDGARILWSASRSGEAATRAESAARAFLALDQPAEASAAHRVLAQILLNDGQPGLAETAIRRALAEAPDGLPRDRLVDILDATLRAQGRDTAADQCWGEYGLPTPED
jgi:tetratricopeptide (TPR) repeat protein